MVKTMEGNKFENNKKKPNKAIALSYNTNEEAPKVVATGQGYVAEKILDIAKEKKVPIHKDEKLVERLSSLNIGENIPPELYEVVAQILVFVGDMDKIKGRIYDI